MAITSGAGPHQAWISVGGGTFLILHGSVNQHASRTSSTFSCVLPMNGGAEAAFASLGDNTATVSCVTRGIEGVLLVGEVDKIEFDYINRTIHASGRDLSSRLHENQTSENWTNKKPSEIVADLAGRVGLGFKGDSSKVMAGDRLTQDYVKMSDNTSFAYIIQKCAELDGARWWVDPAHPVLNYVVFGNPSGVYVVNYAFEGIAVTSDTMDLRVHVNVPANKTIQVTVKSWHQYDKQVYQSTVTIPGQVAGQLLYNHDIPNAKQDHTQQHAESKADEAARHRIRVEATVAGDPTCAVNMMLQLNGTDFSGQYEMDTVVHTIGDQGHKTHITARSFAEDSQEGGQSSGGTSGVGGTAGGTSPADALAGGTAPL